ncbi:MAG: dehydrogenase [Cytophagales bacterium]|nr:MAG: dehydrogenase [Cytophagales bacterium]
MKFEINNHSEHFLKELYHDLVLPRLIEEKMLVLLRQGEISKWFSGIGQEAIAVGVTKALQTDEYILPLHRNLGVFTTRQIPLAKLFCQLQGKEAGFTKGRDRSFHFGSKEHHIVGMISHLGAMLAVGDGIALAEKLSKSNKVVLAFSGDGGTSEGDFHESLNLAAVWSLPIIYLIENNGYGLSTPNNEQFKINSLCEKAAGYGIDAISIDGNDILEVINKVSEIAESIRNNSRPVLIEAKTFRMRGHEEASGVKYVPDALFKLWDEKDPISNYEEFLLHSKIISEYEVLKIRKDIKEKIDLAWNYTQSSNFPIALEENELKDVYAPFYPTQFPLSSQNLKTMRYIDAISQSLQENLNKHPNLILMGQDIAEYGGVFKVTEGLVDVYGKDRIRNTPLCESAVIGAGLGLAIKNYKSVIEMQFADFVSCGFNQIINNLAKSHYRWAQAADVVIRMPTGAGVGAGPFHSQSNEAWFFHTPGLKIVFPSCPSDAKGLLNAAISDPNPILFFEHKMLYRSISEEVAQEYYQTEIGKAKIISHGTQMTLITYGMGVHWAIEAKKEISDEIEIIDLRTLLPWDKETIEHSIKKTGKALIITEDCLTGSIASEIAAWISENCFELLDAPVSRIGSIDTPIPFAPSLEENFLPKKRIYKKIIDLINY